VGLDFTVTLGVVSNPKRSAAEVGAPHLKGSYIQTDAALNSGNSGGPLVNDLGEVVGINTMVRTNTEAIGFAIPINRVKEIYSVLRSGKKPTHGYFGMEVMSITPDNVRIHNEDPNSHRLSETHGALVMRVVPGSPADKSGLRRNDIIVGINNVDVRSADEAEDLLDRARPGAGCVLQVLRGESGRKLDLDAVPQDLHVLLEEKRKAHLQHPMVVLKPKY
jgi:S1-C subfamily serine protease